MRNERGERLLQFCRENELVVTNTLFKHHPRRLYTWKSPGDRYRNQIDFIMVKSRFKTSATNCKTFPGADCGSDYHLLVMEHKLKLKRTRPQSNFRKITQENINHFQTEIQPSLVNIKGNIEHQE